MAQEPGQQGMPVALNLDLNEPPPTDEQPEIEEVVLEAPEHLQETFKDAAKWSESADFLGLQKDAVSFLLQSELLEGDSEEEVLEGTLAWVLQNRSTWAERQEAMAEFSHFIRFGCMRGEYLLDFVLSDPSMGHPETKKRVKRGLYFQAYSDERKAGSEDMSFQERRGIQEGRLEFMWNFRLSQDSFVEVDSQPADWLGCQWLLRLIKRKQTTPETPTVGIYLIRLTSAAVQSASTKIFFCFYIWTWPSGLWETIGEPHTNEFKGGYNDSSGFGDTLGMSWDEARSSKKYVGATRHITVKVVMRRR